MLNPTISQHDLSQALSASNTVTNFAQAVVSAVPDLPDPPAWFAAVQNDIDTAQAHSQSWVDTICPAVTSTIPGAIVDFNQSFQGTATQLLSMLQAIENQSGAKPTPAQRTTVSAQINSLIAAIEIQQKNVGAVNTQVAAYLGFTNTDQQTLQNDLGEAAKQIKNGAAAVAEITGAIGENFLDSQVLGPCNVIVNIDLNITIKVNQTEADPGLITTIFASLILENLTGNVQSAQRSLQDIADAWAILLNKYTAVLTDLQDASDDQYLEGFKQLDLETAQTQWQQLATFAATLTNANPPLAAVR